MLIGEAGARKFEVAVLDNLSGLDWTVRVVVRTETVWRCITIQQYKIIFRMCFLFLISVNCKIVFVLGAFENESALLPNIGRKP